MSKFSKTLKKLAAVAITASMCALVMPVTVKANVALDQATEFKGIQNNYYTATTTYYNNYQVPVINEYKKAMTYQMSQALASNYQARTMAQQAQYRAWVNNFQLGTNYQTYMMNLNTQYQTMMNQSMYNYQNMMDIGYAANMQAVNNVYGYMLGQAPFPQQP